MSRHAFVDESVRGREYIICAASISADDLGRARRTLRPLRAPGQQRIHFGTESDRRRRALLGAMADVNASYVVFVTSHRNQITARREILVAMVPRLRSTGIGYLVLESRDGQDDRDRSVLYSTVGPHPTPPFTYTHHRPTSEPLLWLPDAVAWAWGRGRKWRTLLDDLDMLPSVVEVDSC